MIKTRETSQEPAQPPEELLTVEEVAQLLRVDGTTVRRWIKCGALEAVILPHVNNRQGYHIRRSTLTALYDGTRQKR